MFVYDFTLLEVPFDRARSRLLADDGQWLATLAGARDFTHDGGDPDTGSAQMLVGPARDRSDGVTIAVDWSTDARSGHSASSLDGDLRLAPLTDASVHLSFSGYYTPTVGRAAGGDERLRLQRFAEVAVRSFLESVARSL